MYSVTLLDQQSDSETMLCEVIYTSWTRYVEYIINTMYVSLSLKAGAS